MNRRLYALHRYLSALIVLQLALWVGSGAFFAIVPIERVRGESVPGAHQRPLPQDASVLPPSQALHRLSAAGLEEPSSLELRHTPAGLFYLARAGKRALRLDARTGVVAPVTHAEATATARRDQPGQPEARSGELLTEAPDVEYRGRPLPAWRIRLGDAAGTVVYVDATTGEVTARRTDLWRTYDFLWSLHIMDYREREHFNHPLLVTAALLAALAIASGAVLWGLRIGRWLRRRATGARPRARGPAP